ncbi:hypothetical protein [Hoeflea olei]|uniref:Uncharacterized protein n=1 Tax=Hoeflea olei TaxID=1480615 RepID=A0A1C1YWL8_9HYPH|nr:hypothetical protein [Hoeflea olei]OCW57891.1 hypothetical protein AWJ14_03620 [Hoeflea olei]
MPVLKNSSMIDPVDVQVGGDADLDGIAQTTTADDIEAVLMSPAPVAERIETLNAMRTELQARSHADRGGEMDPLLDEVEAAIARLSGEA